jgi:1,4-dihydroxy-2-naphthoate octaprenyltransferase
VLPDLQPYSLLAEVVLFVVIPPAFAFFIQSEDFHRLLTLTVLPLIAAYLSYPLLLSLKWFGRDYQLEQKTFATLVGWERAMVYHNALILLAYLLFALIALLDFPWFLLWPVFLTLPIGLLEVWLMERVRRGKKPLWRIMQVATACVYFIPMYLIGFAFWIR